VTAPAGWFGAAIVEDAPLFVDALAFPNAEAGVALFPAGVLAVENAQAARITISTMLPTMSCNRLEFMSLLSPDFSNQIL